MFDSWDDSRRCMFDYVRPGGLGYSVLADYIVKVSSIHKLKVAEFNKLIALILTKSVDAFMCFCLQHTI